MADIRTAGRVAAAGLLMVLLMFLLAGCGGQGQADSVPVAPVDGNVLDEADVLSSEEEGQVNAAIDAGNDRSDNARVAVLMVEGIDGGIEDFAQAVATDWAVGDEGADNGVLIVADTAEREIRIETAEGVRERFSDDDAEDVIDDVLGPAFADGDLSAGLTEAVRRIYLYADGQAPEEEPFDWALFTWVAAPITVVVGAVIWWGVAHARRLRREADEEIRAAEAADPSLRLTQEQRAAYRSYRSSHRGDDAVSNPGVWLPLFIANPSLYSGGGTGTSSGSSFNGGGGFTGGGASGSY